MSVIFTKKHVFQHEHLDKETIDTQHINRHIFGISFQ